MAGAGRKQKDDKVDNSAGIVLNAGKGDKVKKGDLLMTIYSSTVVELSEIGNRALDAVIISDTVPDIMPVVYKIIK